MQKKKKITGDGNVCKRRSARDLGFFSLFHLAWLIFAESYWGVRVPAPALWRSPGSCMVRHITGSSVTRGLDATPNGESTINAMDAGSIYPNMP